MNHPPSPISRRWRVWGILAVAAFTVGAALTPASSASASELQGDVTLIVTSVTAQPVGRGASSAGIDVTIANTSTNNATHARVTFEPPSSVSVDPASSSAGCSVDTGNLTCVIDAIPAGTTTSLRFGVVVADPDTPIGVRGGRIAPITADQYNVAGPQIVLREWDHESDGQGADLQQCWPLSNPSPNMDINGGGVGQSASCDGNNDHPALAPDRVSYSNDFPASVTGHFTRSWEIEFEFVADASDSYRLCAQNVDDGGYVAVSPAGDAPSSADIRLSTPTWGPSFTSAPFTLSAGTRYHLIYRVANRGGVGIDNGGVGLGGFGALGIAPSSRTCDPTSDVAAFGASSSLRRGAGVPIDIRPSSDLEITGALVGTSGTKTISSARVANIGHDPAATTVMVNAAASSSADKAGCVLSSGRAKCDLGVLEPNSDSIWTFEVAPTADESVSWDFTALSSIEATLTGNRVKLR